MYSRLFQLHANFIKALAHPRRLEIIQLLRDQELPVTDIHSMLDLPQANISQHLSILRENKIVQFRKVGKQIYYSMASKKITRASDLIREYLVDVHQELASADELKFSMKDLTPIVHDPVCKMRLSPQTAGFHITHNDQEYFFCASGCLRQFNSHPERYAVRK